MIERFGKSFVCFICAKATDYKCSGCEKPICHSCFATHRLCPNNKAKETPHEAP